MRGVTTVLSAALALAAGAAGAAAAAAASGASAVSVSSAAAASMAPHSRRPNTPGRTRTMFCAGSSRRVSVARRVLMVTSGVLPM